MLFGREEKVGKKFVVSLLERLERESDAVAQEATTWLCEHGTGSASPTKLMTERVMEAIQMAKAFLGPRESHNPDLADTVKCPECGDTGYTTVYLTYENRLYECSQPCSANCDAAARTKQAVARALAQSRKELDPRDKLEVVAQFTRLQDLEEIAWRQRWIDKNVPAFVPHCRLPGPPAKPQDLPKRVHEVMASALRDVEGTDA